MVPIHWNIHNQPDNYAHKMWSTLLFPSITLLCAILFKFLPKLDPRKEAYVQFARPWSIIQNVLILFFAYVYFVSILATLDPSYNIGAFIMTGIGVLFVLLGNYLGKVRQNYFVGIKTPWTLASEEVWNKTHRIGGWAFVVAGVMLILNGLLYWHVAVVFTIAIVLAVVVPIVYSYVIFKKLPRKD
jgi:uncharacterized membrane protein